MDGQVKFRERDQPRLRRRLKAIGGGEFTSDDLDRLVAGDLSAIRGKPRHIKRAVVPLIKDPADPVVRGHLEQMVGETLDLVPMAYVTSARKAADAVCRVITVDRKAKGTGLMVAPGVLVTNHHVIPSAGEAESLLAQFNHELDNAYTPLPSTEFALDPDAFFWTSSETDLDVTIIGVGDLQSGDTTRTLSSFGTCPLSSADDKHAAGDFVTVVQHPGGDYKQIGLRDNRVLGRGKGGTTLHYATDTLPGSSGSPVFNDQFVLVAIHHAGGPRLETELDTGEAISGESNEGIRVSAILAKLAQVDGGVSDRHEEVKALLLPPQ